MEKAITLKLTDSLRRANTSDQDSGPEQCILSTKWTKLRQRVHVICETLTEQEKETATIPYSIHVSGFQLGH